MRIGEVLLKYNKAFQDLNNIKFQELLPLQLKNKVSGKGEKGADIACIQDMAVMFACMKANEFKESVCAKEIRIFNECYTNHKATKQAQKVQETSGKMIPGAKTLSHRQMSRLLERHPQFNEPRHKLTYRK